ncbi:MAG: hypothetical protein EOP06_04025 [Proteobacteria bacterium]|nr:MAG: hypothetical protein EOP06_04025 [Pseudomonadota bacterium]
MTEEVSHYFQHDLSTFKILSDLVSDADTSLVASTQLIFGISENYMKKESSVAIKEFYDLYMSKNQKREEFSNEVNKEVDEMVREIEETGTATEDDGRKARRLALSALQKKLEGLITLDQGIRSEILPALNTIQFAATLRERLTGQLYVLDQLMKTSPSLNPEVLAETWMTSVQSLSVPEDVEILFSKLFPSDSENEDSGLQYEKLTAGIKFYLDQLVKWATIESERTTDFIFKCIEGVTKNFLRVSQISSTSRNALSALEGSLSEVVKSTEANRARIVGAVEHLSVLSRENAELREVIDPLSGALQFQDRLRQNLENIAKVAIYWMGKRSEEPEDVTTYGLALLKCATMESERNIMANEIPTLAEHVKASMPESDMMLF